MNDLAEGFARHLVAWARMLQAPADSLAVLDLAARRLALATSAGHVCVGLDVLLRQARAELAGEAPVAAGAEDEHDVRDASARLAQLRHQLHASGVVIDAAHAIDGASAHPLVLDSGDRLYLRRHFDQERALAQALVARAAPALEGSVPALLDSLFPPRAADSPD